MWCQGAQNGAGALGTKHCRGSEATAHRLGFILKAVEQQQRVNMVGFLGTEKAVCEGRGPVGRMGFYEVEWNPQRLV